MCQIRYGNLLLAKVNSIVLSVVSGLLFNLPVFKFAGIRSPGRL